MCEKQEIEKRESSTYLFTVAGVFHILLVLNREYLPLYQLGGSCNIQQGIPEWYV